jgi:hypothetical protein
MRSKTLSNQDRERILSKVRAAAEAQWEASPLKAELAEAIAQAQAIIDKEQLRIIPLAHRPVLDQYGGETVTRTISMTRDDTGRVLYTWGRCSGHKTNLRYAVYSAPSAPSESLRDDEKAFKLLNSTAPELLARICEIDERHKCETDEIVAAHKAILDTCNTTKQAHDNELLRPYLPADLLAWEPKAPGDAARAISETALARAKAFQASIAKEA